MRSALANIENFAQPSLEPHKQHVLMNPELSRKVDAIRPALIWLVVLHNTSFAIQNVWNAKAVEGSEFVVPRYFLEAMGTMLLPLFFAISGYLFFHRFKPEAGRFLEKFQRRFTTIVWPYLIWSALWIAAFFVLQQLPGALAYFSNPDKIVANWSPLQFLYKLIIDPLPYQFFFLRTLIALFALTPIIYWLVNRFGIVTLLVAATFWAIELKPLLVVGGFPLLPGNALCPFLLGTYLAIHKPIDLTELEKSLPGRRILGLAWIVLAALTVWFEAFQNAKEAQMALACLGLVAAWCNYDLVRSFLESDFSRRLGQHFFFIFAAHEPFLVIPTKLILQFAGEHVWAFHLAVWTIPIVVVLICFLVAEFFLRFLQPAYFVLNGWRGEPVVANRLSTQ